jgi:hypothetical protein
MTAIAARLFRHRRSLTGLEGDAQKWQTAFVLTRHVKVGAVMQHALAKSLKVFAYFVVLLMIAGIAYSSYISLRYFDGIGV